MSVRVRLFAALREAAGVAEVDVEPAPLDALLDELCARYGEPFTTRLSVASVLLDGDPVGRSATLPVPDGAELALLPPVSGGSPAGDRGGSPLD